MFGKDEHWVICFGDSWWNRPIRSILHLTVLISLTTIKLRSTQDQPCSTQANSRLPTNLFFQQSALTYSVNCFALPSRIPQTPHTSKVWRQTILPNSAIFHASFNPNLFLMLSDPSVITDYLNFSSSAQLQSMVPYAIQCFPASGTRRTVNLAYDWKWLAWSRVPWDKSPDAGKLGKTRKT